MENEFIEPPLKNMKPLYESTVLKILTCAMPSAIALTGCSDGTNNLLVKPEANADGNYNILFITVDQEAYMESYPQGSDYVARERLRKIGTTFEKHYACSNVSTSSRSVIYTGRHVTETHMMDNTNLTCQPNMSKDLKTVGDMMREAGYYAAYKGKWHISEGDTSLEEYGFSDWTEGGMYGSPLEGFHEDETIAKRACDWLETKGKGLNASGKSFFLAVNFINPHDIMFFNETASGTFGQATTAPNTPLYQKTYPTPVPSTWNEPLDKEGRPSVHKGYHDSWEKATGPTPSSEKEWKSFRDYYFNCIKDCDNQCNLLLEYLEKNDLMKNTVIIFTSDHGELMGEHGLKGKAGNMYENNIHVPLMIYHPEYPGGRSCNHVTSHLDLAPTFVDLATDDDAEKKKIADGIKGYSLMPAVKNPAADVRNGQGALFVYDMISMMDEDMVSIPVSESTVDIRVDLEKKGYLRGIITADYKFARYFSPLHFNTPTEIDALYAQNEVELYRMGSDETENLAWPKGNNKELVEEYNDKLNAIIKREIGIDDGRETEFFRGGLMKYAR